MPKKQPAKAKETKTYGHNQDHPLRPDIGTEAQFKKKKPPVTYRYDSSLSPSLEWDTNPAREQVESEINAIANYLTELSTQLQKINDVQSSLGNDSNQALNELKNLLIQQVNKAQESLDKLKSMSKPFLNWTGKAERLSFDVPTLPLFIHERLSTRAIIETLKSHKVGAEQLNLFDLFSDPKWSITDQILKAYEYQGNWVNRMILGDSLVVMNSLLQYEGLGGQVQMIYMDPPYGVKFGSNFQPFVRKRDVKHNDDEDFTREPEMVQAYRDTWNLGLHSYLTYLRDRLLLARELLTDSGSIFVQISDENVHHVRELMDEVFDGENFCSFITYRTSVPLTSSGLAEISDYLIWYAKDKSNYKYKDLFLFRQLDDKSRYSNVELADGSKRTLTTEEKANPKLLPSGSRIFADENLVSSGYTSSCTFDFEYNGKIYRTSSGKSWKTNKNGMEKLAQVGRIKDSGKTLRYIIYLDDFPVIKLTNNWQDTAGDLDKYYVVQTHSKVIQRCLLMTTDPGDLVLDITCGSGTTAYVAEQWGRRWITCDISRVPLALARQRLLTATFPWYQLKDGNSPAGGFVYKRKKNNKGEEIGGIVPHITLKSIANDEPPDEEILVDRPESDNGIVRVSSPFTIEGTIPPPVEMEDQDAPETQAVDIDSTASFIDRMLEVLRKSPKLYLPNNSTVTFTNVRKPTKSQSLSAEGMVDDKPVAFVFGPENGAIAEGILFYAATEAKAKQYDHLYVIGFAIAAKARQFVEHCHETMDIPATYVQATPDLLMGDLLKNMRSSQIFSVCGLPEIEITKNEEGKYQVELLGLDVFDPITMEVDHQQGKNVPAWFLDTNYNGLCFYVRQAFFPRTSAWDSIKKALKGSYEDSIWEHLASTTSEPFDVEEHKQVAVKVIDDRGNELLVIKEIKQ